MTDRPDGKGLTYRDAGVDIDAMDGALRKIKDSVRSTRTPGVLTELGSFGGMFALEPESTDGPVLVASADGVGTKLRVAFLAGVHDTVGRDLVHHCVNDILVQGARPLFFMDYVATGRLDPSVVASIVQGIATGCRNTGCALLGGETAEMPDFYGDGEYDVAGFVVGRVERGGILDGSRVAPGDRLLGLASTGLHTNGYSLARKVFFEVCGLQVSDPVSELGTTVGEALLDEHRCYLRPIEPLLDDGRARALAHITGGGLTDNLPRILPAGTGARIDLAAWEVPALFRFLQDRGGVASDEMFRAFNMGIGMVVVVRPDDRDAVLSQLRHAGETAFDLGEVISGDGGVRYE